MTHWYFCSNNCILSNKVIFTVITFVFNTAKFSLLKIYNQGQKSWDTFAFLRRFQFTQVQPLPSPHKQCWTRVSRIFSEFQLCIGWGTENLKKIAKRMHCFEVFRYSFSETMPMFFNLLKSDFILVRSLQNFHRWLTMNWSLSKCSF